MSEHKTRNYEARCLLEILATLVNEEESPKWKVQMDWGELYKLADYHNVANDVYYKIMAAEEKGLTPWKKKFEERFHGASASEDRYGEAIKEVLGALEAHKIHCMVLKDYYMRTYYPRNEMRALDCVEILMEEGKQGSLDKIMEDLDFQKKERRQDNGIYYYKIPGIHFVFQENLEFTDKKMKGYFNAFVKSYPRETGYRYVHKHDEDDLYLYVIGALAEDYARGRLEIRDMLDFWYYYLSVYSFRDWEYIRKELTKLKLEEFGNNLVKLAAFWFGRMSFPEELELFRGMEEYILTKGIKGRKESAALLPLVKEVADFYKRDLKRERRKQRLKWMFPEREYMEVVFPFLKKRPKMIPVCWGLRMFRSFYFTSRNKTIDIKENLTVKARAKKEKYSHTIEKCQRMNISISEKWRGFRVHNMESVLSFGTKKGKCKKNVKK